MLLRHQYTNFWEENGGGSPKKHLEEIISRRRGYDPREKSIMQAEGKNLCYFPNSKLRVFTALMQHVSYLLRLLAIDIIDYATEAPILCAIHSFRPFSFVALIYHAVTRLDGSKWAVASQ